MVPVLKWGAPGDLILRVSASFPPEEIGQAGVGFDHFGLGHLNLFAQALAGVGRTFEEFDRLLDFGCGCGRFIRHMGTLAERAEVHGSDIDAEMIEWCSRNIPFGRFALGSRQPPSPYDDGYFDLIINHSVFSHLGEHDQNLWLAELQRICAPDGLLMLTVEGEHTFNSIYDLGKQSGDPVERWREELETRGILSITNDAFVGSTHPESYHTRIHAPWYIFEHWSQYFDIVAHLVKGSASQDLLVLRRRPDGTTPPRPVGRRLARDLAPRGGLGSGEAPTSSPEISATDIARSLNMLRSGLCEQGNRISVLATQLRSEIDAVRAHPSGSASGSVPGNWRGSYLDRHPTFARGYRRVKRLLLSPR